MGYRVSLHHAEYPPWAEPCNGLRSSSSVSSRRRGFADPQRCAATHPDVPWRTRAGAGANGRVPVAHSAHRLSDQREPLVRHVLRDVPRSGRRHECRHFQRRADQPAPRHRPDAARRGPRLGGRPHRDARRKDGSLRHDPGQSAQRHAEPDPVRARRHPQLLELRRAFCARRSHVLVAGRPELSQPSLHRRVAVGRCHQ